MSRYINVDDLKADMIIEKRDFMSCGVTLNYASVRGVTMAQILTAPSIDIVRCKECKKANTEDCSLSYWDDDWGKWRVGYIGDEWFCADGEREGE